MKAAKNVLTFSHSYNVLKMDKLSFSITFILFYIKVIVYFEKVNNKFKSTNVSNY